MKEALHRSLLVSALLWSLAPFAMADDPAAIPGPELEITALPATPDWIIEGNSVHETLGWSVASAGDVNGDGTDDVIVGAYNFPNAPLNQVGRVLVFHGGSGGLQQTPDWSAEGGQFGEEFGWSVATTGDVNGDGYADVIIGAPSYSLGPTSTNGRVAVYHGSGEGLSKTPNWTLTGAALEGLGAAVASAGDVNCDGFDDVIISGPGYADPDLGLVGRAVVYLGSADGLEDDPSWAVLGTDFINRIGPPVASAGDVNGDNCSDVIVGQPLFSDDQVQEGRALVFHGSPEGLSETANWTAKGGQWSSHFGAAVASAGDVNGDGYSDVIVGAPNFKTGPDEEDLFNGRAFVFHGSLGGLSPAADWTAEIDEVPLSVDPFFGSSVAAAGDVNGDGFADVIVGAPGHVPSGSLGRGVALVYTGSEDGLATEPAWTDDGGGSYGDFGHSAATAGDVNGDGVDDVIVGAPEFNRDPLGTVGRAFVYHGSRTAPLPPILCSASATPASGEHPLMVAFEARASDGEAPYSYDWDFDDGGSSTHESPSHTYREPGTYIASVTVTDAGHEPRVCEASVPVSVLDCVTRTIDVTRVKEKIKSSPERDKVKITLKGTNYLTDDRLQIDNGTGYQDVPVGQAAFKKGKKVKVRLIGSDLFPRDSCVTVRIRRADGCADDTEVQLCRGAAAP